MRLRLPRLCLLARLFRDLYAHPQAQCPFPPRCGTPGHDLPRGCPRPPPPARAVRALPHRPVLPLPLRPMTPPLSPPPLCPPRISLLSHNFSPHKKAACLPRIPLFYLFAFSFHRSCIAKIANAPAAINTPASSIAAPIAPAMAARRAFPAAAHSPRQKADLLMHLAQRLGRRTARDLRVLAQDPFEVALVAANRAVFLLQGSQLGNHRLAHAVL